MAGTDDLLKQVEQLQGQIAENDKATSGISDAIKSISKRYNDDNKKLGALDRVKKALDTLDTSNATNEYFRQIKAGTVDSTTWSKQQIKDSLESITSAITGRDMTGALSGGGRKKDYTDTLKEYLGAKPGLLTTTGSLAAGMATDPSASFNTVGKVFTGIKLAGSKAITLSREIPTVEKAFDNLGRMFDVFHDVEKILPAKKMQEFKDAFRIVANSSGPNKYDELKKFGIFQESLDNRDLLAKIMPGKRLNDEDLKWLAQKKTDWVMQNATPTVIPADKPPWMIMRKYDKPPVNEDAIFESILTKLKGNNFGLPLKAFNQFSTRLGSQLEEKSRIGYVNIPGISSLRDYMFRPEIANLAEQSFVKNNQKSTGALGLYDKFQTWYKQYVTVAFPSFHARNDLDATFRMGMNDVGPQDIVSWIAKRKDPATKELAAKLGVTGSTGMMGEQSPLAFMGKLVTAQENFFRGSQWTALMRKGETPMNAAHETARIMGEYNPAYSTKFEKDVLGRFDMWYKYTKSLGTAWTPLFTNQSQKLTRVAKIYEVTQPDEFKDAPWMKPPFMQNQLMVGKTYGFGTSLEDLLRLGSLDTRAWSGHINPALRIPGELIADYSPGKGKSVFGDNSSGNYKHVDPITQGLVGYNGYTNTTNPLAKYLTEQVGSRMLSNYLNYSNPDKSLLTESLPFKIANYDDQKLSRMYLMRQQQGMQMSSGTSGGLDALMMSTFGGSTASADAAGGVPPTPMNKAQREEFNRIRTYMIGAGITPKSTDLIGITQEYLNMPVQRDISAAGQGRAVNQSINTLSKLGEINQLNPDVKTGWDNYMKFQRQLDAYTQSKFGNLSREDVENQKRFRDMQDYYGRPRGSEESPLLTEEMLTKTRRPTAGGPGAMSFARAQDLLMAFQNKTGTMVEQGMYKHSVDTITFEAEHSLAVLQQIQKIYPFSFSEDTINKRIKAILGVMNDKMIELNMKLGADQASTIKTWSEGMAEGVNKINIERIAALKEFENSEKARRLITNKEFDVYNSTIDSINAKYSQKQIERKAHEAKILAEMNTNIAKEQYGAVMAELDTQLAKGSLTIKEFYDKQKNMLIKSTMTPATNWIDDYLANIKTTELVPTEQTEKIKSRFTATLKYATSGFAPETLPEKFRETKFKAHDVEGKVAAIIDGDTFDMLTKEGKKLRIRTSLSDAQETAHGDKPGQPYGEAAKKALGELLVTGTPVNVHVVDEDRGRMVGFATNGKGQDVSKAMLATGMSFLMPNFITGADQLPYVIAANSAKQSKVGMWTNPEKPPEDPYTNRAQKQKTTKGEFTDAKLDAWRKKVEFVISSATSLDDAISRLKTLKIPDYIEYDVTEGGNLKKTITIFKEKTIPESVKMTENLTEVKKMMAEGKPPEDILNLLITAHQAMQKMVPQMGDVTKLDEARKGLVALVSDVQKKMAVSDKDNTKAQNTLNANLISLKQTIMAKELAMSNKWGAGMVPGTQDLVGSKRAERMRTDAQEKASISGAEEIFSDLTKAQGAIGLSGGTPQFDSSKESGAAYMKRVETQLRTHYDNMVDQHSIGGQSIETILRKIQRNQQNIQLEMKDTEMKILQERLSVAQNFTSNLSGTFNNLYQASGQKSRAYFYMMKATAIAEATVNGISAVIKAYQLGNTIGGPIAGAAAAAAASAFVGSQIGLLAAAMVKGPGKAKGGKITDGKGGVDDVPITAMKDEWIINANSSHKYGDDFMNALNLGKIDISNMTIPSLPEKSPCGVVFRRWRQGNSCAVQHPCGVKKPERDTPGGLQAASIMEWPGVCRPGCHRCI